MDIDTRGHGGDGGSIIIWMTNVMVVDVIVREGNGRQLINRHRSEDIERIRIVCPDFTILLDGDSLVVDDRIAVG